MENINVKINEIDNMIATRKKDIEKMKEDNNKTIKSIDRVYSEIEELKEKTKQLRKELRELSKKSETEDLIIKGMLYEQGTLLNQKNKIIQQQKSAQ